MSEVRKPSEVATNNNVASLFALLTDSSGNLSKTAVGNLSQVSVMENKTGAAIASSPGLNLVFIYTRDDLTKYWIGFYWRYSSSDCRCVSIASSGISVICNGFGTISVNNEVNNCVYRAYTFKPAIT